MNDENVGAGEKSAEELAAELEKVKAEKEALQKELVERTPRQHRPFPWRNFIAWIMVILAFVLAIGAPLASWSHDYLLDTDRFVSTVAPLIREEEVAKAISDRAATTLVEELDIEARLERALPEEIGFIASPIAGGVQTLAQKAAQAILTSDQFYYVWERILALSHSTAVAAIRGEGALELTQQGDIVLDLNELLQNLKDRLVEAGLTFLERVPVPETAGKVVLFTSDELGIARGSVHLLDTLNWILPLLALLFFAAAVIVSTDRRRFLMISGIGIALAMAITLISLNLAKNQLLGLIKMPENLTAAQLVWVKVFRNLVQIQYGILALGVVVAAVSAVAGPYGWAVWLRGKTAGLFEDWQNRRQRGVKEPGPVGKFIETHKMALRVGGLVLVAIILLLLPTVTVGVVIGLGVALLVYLLIIELLRAPEPKAAVEEQATPEENAARPQEKKEEE